jgi:TusA-related sulfurtransferase
MTGGVTTNVPRVVGGDKEAIDGHSVVVSAELDLRGVACPLSWARAKVRLEELARGEEIDLLLDDPQGARDLPRAAEAAGHHVVGIARDGAAWRITIEA